MKKSITYIAILFSFSVSLAQWTQLQPELLLKPMPVLLDSVHAGVNFYDFAGNIAGLFEDEHHFSLWAGSGIDYTDGGYRLPFEPTIRNDQQYTVRNRKTATGMFTSAPGFRTVTGSGGGELLSGISMSRRK
ncbi:hypothetical protein B1H10_07575 [candidate division KSB1 bacterium 4484_188]|nr:MAG: hypothetical protein B1H10_07575 [candidate division KSB1 bacterium 4484_188]